MSKSRNAESVNVIAWIASLLGFNDGQDWL
jgi:hypothetical protein